MDTPNWRRTVAEFFGAPEILADITRVAKAVGGIQELVVVGGVLRELALRHFLEVSPFLRDLDIVVLRDFDTSKLVRALGRKTCSENTFGGIKWRTHRGMEIDIWSAPSQASQLGRRLKSRFSATEFISMLDFNINAGLYIPATGEVRTGAILRAIRARRIEMHNSLVGSRDIQVARILRLERRLTGLGFILGAQLGQYLESVAGRLTSRELVRARSYFVRKSLLEPRCEARAYFAKRLEELGALATRKSPAN